ncbi:DUF1629 domain-containing protein [Uliginosibacterium sp. H3]|uniref:DUF1629 domain-containing protein n=1 Tax=Uliginosibacterium silvisoli TaxID=3114758 RepID=A0ABU6K6Y9_9RHOO|nr:DUF1629 domain-containing protein [Uliginosibacterium sp. H3]
MLDFISPIGQQQALVNYTPDTPDDDIFARSWLEGARFSSPPPVPVVATIPASQAGLIPDLIGGSLPMMSKRLAEAIESAGVSNIDFYEAEIDDQKSGQKLDTHLAFNIVGVIAAADLAKSAYSAPDGPLISVEFSSLAIDPSKAQGARLFRLAEFVAGIVVHESVKQAIEQANITTLTFTDPAEWAS